MNQERPKMPLDEAHTASDSNGAGVEAGAAFCLEFVNMNVSSQVEKQRNQKVIRSTAMKNFRHRQQSQRIHTKEVCRMTNEIGPQHPPQRIKRRHTSKDGDGTVHEGQRKKIEDECSQDPRNSSSQAMDDWISQSPLSKLWHESQAISTEYGDSPRSSEVSQIEVTLNDFSAVSSPMTLLGGGRVDPFRVYPVDYVAPHVHELIDHCESKSSSVQKTLLISHVTLH
jgi:hypothetical protein